jgi:O-antigen ligase
MALCQAVVLGLIALIITPGYFCYFDVTPKVVVLLLGTAVLLLWPRLAAPRVFSVLILLNLASLAVSTAVSTRPGLSLIGTSWREFGLIPQAAALLFAWTVAAASGSARVVLRGVAVAGIAAGAYGIAQYFGWDPLLPASAYHVGEGIWTIVRPPGTMGYVSYFATWLTMAAFLGVALAQGETHRAWRFLAWGSAAVCAFAMLLTGTRAAMLGLAAGAGVWLWFRGARLSRGAVWRIGAAAALLALAGAAFYFSPAGWNLRSRSRWFAEDTSGGGRLLLWRDTLRMPAARPLTGFGPETFTAQFARFESAELARLRPDFEWESAHNMFLDVLAAQGVPGLIALAALCGAALWAGFREPGDAMTAGLTAALVAGIVCQQFSALTVPTAVTIYVICGLLLGGAGRRAVRSGSANRKARRQGRSPGPTRVVVAIVLVAFAIRLAASDHSLALAQNRLKAGDSAGAAASYASYRSRLLAGELAADLWYSRASLGLAQSTVNPAIRIQALTQGQAAAARATQTADDSFNAWYNLAAFDALSGDSAAAERHLRSAIAARPNWFKPHWTLARLLLLESRTAEAEPEAARALYLDGGKNPEVSQTLADVRAQLHR